jgi:hypothetical protein
MTNKHTDTEIHELTTAEIARQVRLLSARRREIVEERAAIYADALKNGGGSGSPMVDADERAAREHAKALLNGNAPASLFVPPELTRDKVLSREQRGIDLALDILGRQELVTRAADAVLWAEKHGDRWHALCREIVLTAVRLGALEDAARELLAGCVDHFAILWPMTNHIGLRPVSEVSLNELVENALAQGVTSAAEIRKAQNVE